MRVNSEPAVVRGLREQIDSTDMFGSGATISDLKYNEGGDLIGFTVNHQIGAKLAGTDRLFRYRPQDRRPRTARTAAGRPQRQPRRNSGVNIFEIRPELPTLVYPPLNPAVTTVEDACSRYDRAAIPLAVDEEGNVIEWHLKINPHMLLMGPTGTGKTATIDNALVGGARPRGADLRDRLQGRGVHRIPGLPECCCGTDRTARGDRHGRHRLQGDGGPTTSTRDRRALAGKEPFLDHLHEVSTPSSRKPSAPSTTTPAARHRGNAPP